MLEAMKYLKFPSILTMLTFAMLCGVPSLASENAGFKLKKSPITSVFQVLETIFTGECPGWQTSGTGTSGGIRFISLSTPPSANLKVRLTNPETGKVEDKNYTDLQGSSKLGLRRLGNYKGIYAVNYEIYNKINSSVIESGMFSYEIVRNQFMQIRQRQRKQVTRCVHDPHISNQNCNKKVIDYEYKCY